MTPIVTNPLRMDPRAADRAPGLPWRAKSQTDFVALLGRSVDRGRSEEEAARDAAEQFVSIGLVQPLLAQLRSTNQAAPPFAPSNSEKQFQSLMDANIARQITHAEHFPLVDAIAGVLIKRLHQKSAIGKATDGVPKPTRTSVHSPIGSHA